MIHFEYNNRWYDVNPIEFSGGEVHLGLQDRTGLWAEHAAQRVRVATRLQSSKDVMELVLLTELLRRELGDRHHYELTVPYFPYARQDRATDEFTSFSLKAFARVINSLGYNKVVIYDPHSDVAPALIDNVHVVSQFDIITKLFKGVDEFIKETRPVLMAPDAGAAKKIHKIADHYKGCGVTIAEKVRDTTTGHITGTAWHPVCEYNGTRQNFMMIDDICDGGRTFKDLAALIKCRYPKAHITLYVTHGIFSRPFGDFKDLIDRFYCTDTFIPKNMPIGENEPPLFIGQVCPEPLWRRI